MAYLRIRDVARRTPLEYSSFLSDVSGAEVYLKLENLQLTGSYKIRGALNKILLLSEEQRRRGILAVSSGNHAQGVGYAAQKLGIEATVVVPQNTPQTKIDAIRRYGVNLIIYGSFYDEAEVKARELAKQSSMVFISPYNDRDVIAGQGTVGLEICEQKPGLDAVLAPVGAGGLLSGVALAVKKLSPGTRVMGVQSRASPVMYESLKKGEIVDIPIQESIAEGLHGGIEKGAVSFDVCREYVDEVLLVEEEDIRKAILGYLENHHQIAEGSGAVGMAALLSSHGRFRDQKVVAVISGGNIDLPLLKEIVLAI